MSNVAELPKTKNAGTVGWLRESIHRSTKEIFSELKTITPGLAEVMLTCNQDNRRTRPHKLVQMVSDMRSGRWTLNGEPVIFASTGELNDGQHRLQAIVDSKVPQTMLIVFGVDRSSRTTVDQGAARSAGDYLTMQGVANATTIAAMARNLISYERVGRGSLGRTSDITPAEVLDRVTRDSRELATSATYGHRHSRAMKRYTSGTVIAFCHYVLLNEDINDGLSFMEQLCTGESLRRGDPAFTARERLLALETRSTPVHIEIIFRAWNAYRSQRTMRTIPIHGRLPELV